MHECFTRAIALPRWCARTSSLDVLAHIRVRSVTVDAHMAVLSTWLSSRMKDSTVLLHGTTSDHLSSLFHYATDGNNERQESSFRLMATCFSMTTCLFQAYECQEPASRYEINNSHQNELLTRLRDTILQLSAMNSCSCHATRCGLTCILKGTTVFVLRFGKSL